MSTHEQKFSTTNFTEREDLKLASSNTTRTLDSISAAAERAAKVANLVLGVDEKSATDTFTGQLESMRLEHIPEGLVPIASVMIGAEDGKGTIWTPSHVVTGHDQLTTKNGRKVPETSVWKNMFANRPPEWWNKRRPEGLGLSQLAEAPLFIVLADMALRGTNKNWAEQRSELQQLVGGHRSPNTTLEATTPLEWQMMDADAIVGGTDRPDEKTVTRFVQHDQDRSDADAACGPYADVRGGRAYLSGASHVYRDPNVGFRSVMGQKQAS